MRKLLLAIAFILAFARDGTAQVIIEGGAGGSSGGGGTGCNTSGASLLKGDGSGGCGNAISGIDYLATGAITGAGLTQATGKLLGRTSLPDPGAVQEITIGAGLTFNAGSLSISAGQISAAMLAGQIPYSKLVGTDITTVGTIGGGVWQGTPIGSAYLASTGVVAGAYGDATHVARFTTNAAGQITGVSEVTITGTGDGTSTPGGNPGQVQVNIGGVFAGTSGATATATVFTLFSPVVSGCIKDLSGVCVLTLDGASGITVGTGNNLFTFDTSSITALRRVKIPDADSTTVIGSTVVTHQFLTNVGTTGAQSRAQPAFTDLSGSIAISQIAGGVGGGASGSTCLHGDNTWVACGSGGGSTNPGGSNTQLQYNVGGTGFGGITGATTDGTSVTFASTNLIANRPKISVGIADSANNLVIVMPGDATVQLGTGANSLALDTSAFTAARAASFQDADGLVAYMSGTPTDGYCTKWSVVGGIYKIVPDTGPCSTGGSVTSVAASFTGGLITITGSGYTVTGNLAFTVAGTSGGFPYFNSASTWASSGVATNHGVVIGGGAAASPKFTTPGTTGQVLTSNGSSADPTFQDATGGGTAATCTTTALSLQYNAAGSLGCVSAVTSNGTYLTATTGGLRAVDIKDSNGAYSLVLAATASAVNGVTVTNAIAANPATVIIGATGSSTNINLELLAKGSGVVQVGAACASGSSGIQCAGIGQFGAIKLDGIDTGTISILTQSGGGTYNFNMPTTAGTAGFALLSGGGVSAPMTWAAVLTGAHPLLTNPALAVQALTDQATVTWDMNSGNVATLTLGSASRTMAAPTNPPVGGTLALKITQGGSGSYGITWNPVFKWPAATAPVLSTAVGKIDLVTCATFDTGTTFLCNATLDVH